MKCWNPGSLHRLSAMFALWLGGAGAFAKPPDAEPQPIMLVVMDPLAKELACACVKDYGQRDYRKLAARIGTALKQKISIEFSDDLAESMALASPGQEVIVIGEHSLVVRDAKKAALKFHPICELTDLDGMTTLTGSFVVRAADPAKDLKDI